MYPGPFEYVAATDLASALRLLGDGESKPLAGGQSLLAAMNLRLTDVDRLVDLNGVPELQGLRREDGHLVLGALTRHHTVATSPEVAAACPLLAEAASQIGNIRVRHRGTIGGSLAHADPAAELPAVALALDAALEVVGPAGSRAVAAADFFQSYFTTVLQPGELLRSLRFPAIRPREGQVFLELTRRAGDFAVVGIAARLVLEPDGRIAAAAAAATGVGAVPVRLSQAEGLLIGERPSDALWKAVSEAAAAAVDPESDVHASAAYRRHITGVLARRAWQAALERCAGRPA